MIAALSLYMKSLHGIAYFRCLQDSVRAAEFIGMTYKFMLSETQEITCKTQRLN